MEKANTTNIINTVCSQTIIDRLVTRCLTLGASNKVDKQQHVVDIDRLYTRAQQKTQVILNDIPRTIAIIEKLHGREEAKVFHNKLSRYYQYQKQYAREPHKLAMLTAYHDINGAVNLLSLGIDIDTLVSYVIQDQMMRDISSTEDEPVYEFYVCDASGVQLFNTPNMRFNELRNLYTAYHTATGELYWTCTSTGWLQTLDCSYMFIVNERQLTNKQMWHEITNAMQQGHSLYDQDSEPITRAQVVQAVTQSKL